MTKWPLPLPDGNLNRVRLATVAYCGVAIASEVGQLGNSLRSAAYIRLALACLVLIFIIVVTTYRRGRASWWSAFATPALVAVAGAGLKDPVGSIGLALATLILFSLYGSMQQHLARIVGAVAAVPAALAITPFSGGRVLLWNSPTVLAFLLQIVTLGLLARGFYLSMRRTERASRQDAVLASAGNAMLGVTDIARIREISKDAAAELVALYPGLTMLVLSSRAGRFRVVGQAGADAALIGRALSDKTVVDAAQLSLLFPGPQEWHISSIGGDPTTPDAYIAVGAARRVSPDVLDAVRTLTHQAVLAESNCAAHAELDHRAHHDHLTELPTRAKFLRALGHALNDDTGGAVALLNVDLDDFKQVNDVHGHSAGDELLVEVASRLTAACNGCGMAARFGGDEFALLLTGLADPAEAERIAERLITRLATPIELSALTVTVGASIGIAVAEPGSTVADLSRQADMAMYAAKTAGKNRIESYGLVGDQQPAARSGGPRMATSSRDPDAAGR